MGATELDPCTLDCRSFNLPAYTAAILRQREERFSTVYAVCFITEAEAAAAAAVAVVPAPGDLLVTANSLGSIRLFRLSDMVSGWTHGQQLAQPTCGWQAHEGPVYCMGRTTTANGDVLLFSGGDDGHVRAWRLSDVLQQHTAAAAAGAEAGSGDAMAVDTAAPSSGAARHQQRGKQQQLLGGVSLCVQATLDVRLPRAESGLGAISLPPAVQALALVAADGRVVLHAGCSDGGVHSVDVESGAVTQPGGGGGHAAGVLCADHSDTGACLATGSEDGTVRLWDTRGGAAASCVRALDSGSGTAVAPGPEALHCLRSPPVACCRFEASGSWLLCGGGYGGAGGGGSGLAMWSVGMAQRARHVATSYTPQALLVQPAEVLAVGSEAALWRYSVALGEPLRQHLAATRSAFGLDVHPGSGAVAVGGTGASVELLSRGLKKVGGAHFVSEED